MSGIAWAFQEVRYAKRTERVMKEMEFVSLIVL